MWASTTTYDRVAAKTRALAEHHIDRPHEGWVVVCVMSYLVPQEGKKKKRQETPGNAVFPDLRTSVVGPRAWYVVHYVNPSYIPP